MQDPAGRGMVGVGGTTEWTLSAVKGGKAVVKLEYRRPWEKDKPAEKTFTFTVDVRAVPASAPATRPSEADVKRIALEAVTQRWPDWRKEHNVTDDAKVFRDIVRPGLAKDWHVTVKAGPVGGKPPLIVLVRVDPETGAVLEVTKGGGGLP